MRMISARRTTAAFGSSVEPLMPIDYAIGVGTFVPNNAVIMHNDVVKYLSEVMKERGIKHTDVGMHAARLHVLAGQRGSEDRDACRDRENQKNSDRLSGGWHYRRPCGEGQRRHAEVTIWNPSEN